jgi:TolB-like protein/Tfp pilus assembly protein PilF
VLPLENLSGDPAQEYFADGMTESLISNLARIRALKVISRTSAMRYKGSPKSLPEIARELNVDAVIEGSVQRSGGRVRVTAQLIHAATEAHLWVRDYEPDLTDVLKLQSEVARAVADEIRIQITAEERARLASARSVNPQGHEAYLLGRYHFSKNNEQDWKHATEYFEHAIELAPDYAAAHAGLSDAWLHLGIFGVKAFKEVEPPARGAAVKALKLDEQLAEAHIALANIRHFCDWDWAGSEQEFRRALELDPGSFDAHIYYGTLLMHLGRHDEAIREGQIAVQLDPLSPPSQTFLGRFLYRARRYEEAVPHLKRAVELEPRSIGANFRLGDVYAQLGRYDEAIAAFEKIRELTRDERTFRAGIARVHALVGRQREARQMISGVKAQPIDVAGVYAALGDKDEAFRILEKAIEERNSLLVVLKEDPPLENLHSDPRWKALLRRMNFPPE